MVLGVHKRFKARKIEEKEIAPSNATWKDFVNRPILSHHLFKKKKKIIIFLFLVENHTCHRSAVEVRGQLVEFGSQVHPLISKMKLSRQA